MRNWLLNWPGRKQEDGNKEVLMDYMKEIKEISAEQAVILWQASRLSLSKRYEKHLKF